nr:cysteine-rich RLK (receptor-like protein kinase) 8 [Tanacetum cinerariifolium]
MIALNAKNKLKIVTGELVEKNDDSKERAMWDRTNDMIISLILNTISYQISNNLNFINTASALWSELHEHYAQSDGLWDEHDALEAPYLYNCICSCDNGINNGDREQRKRLIQFLMGLDECYSNIRGQIFLFQPLLTVAKAYSMIRPSTGRMSSFKARVHCTNCFKEEHDGDECYKIKGYPVGHPLHGKYKPPVVKNSGQSENRNPKVNLVSGQDAAGNSSQAKASASAGNDVVFVRIDQL